MFVSIGKRARPEGLVGLLMECHQRIRSFSALAEAIGRRRDTPHDERREACTRCRRYFSEALPLHVADEEHSILPRLRGKNRALDAALDAMHAQHDEHLPLLSRLIEELDRVYAQPGDEAAGRRLAEVASRLAADFETHLAGEERVVFPSIPALLTADEQETIVAELRARRGAG